MYLAHAQTRKLVVNTQILQTFGKTTYYNNKLNLVTLILKIKVHVVCCSFRLKIKLTSLAEEPDTSIHVLEKKAQEPNMKNMYKTA